MTTVAIILGVIILLSFAVQLPPIVAFIGRLRTARQILSTGIASRTQRVEEERSFQGRPARILARVSSSSGRQNRGVAVLEVPPILFENGEPLPPAVCVLCLRGRDPFLHECLQGLLNQEYPNYDVLIIVDSESDPAYAAVQEILGRFPPENRRAGEVRVEVLEHVYPYCALKASALIQAARHLRGEPYEVVALLDADTIPHPTWLSELVAPLADPAVGVTAGNRWYMPEDGRWGSLLRYVWNAGAVVQMFWNQFTWGGSVALRKALFCDRELSARWRRSLSTDTVIYQVAKHHGWKTEFVPSVLMVNRESCSLRKLFPWITRQLLVGKLYHPGWPWVVGHGLGTTLILAGGIAFCLLALLKGAFLAFGIVLASLLAYWFANLIVLAQMENAAQEIVRARQRISDWRRSTIWPRLIVALPLAQFFNAVALVATYFVRSVSWRGIRYRLEGRKVIMEAYQPYSVVVSRSGAASRHSL
jgi:cellulose synthase/poly-beta-1,6-N-acetylglucosamine synthase-like glycosyltransferase